MDTTVDQTLLSFRRADSAPRWGEHLWPCAAAPSPSSDRQGPPPADDLLSDCLQPAALHAAWERVRGNEGCAGFDGQSLQEFGLNLEAEIAALADEVSSGHYQARPLRQQGIPKRDGGQRMLAIPAVRDRVLQTAVTTALAVRLEPGFDEASYGYRPGRSVAQAVAEVRRLHDAGLGHVVDADILGFFDHVDHDLLCDDLGHRFPGEHRLLELVQHWLQADWRESPASAGRLADRGLAQGSPLSPLLANLYLDPVDRLLRAAGIAQVRYADDLLLLCGSESVARSSLAVLRDALLGRRLQLNPAKTRLASFETGFSFLGIRFLRQLCEPVLPGSAPWLLREGPATRMLASLDPALTGAAAGCDGAEPAEHAQAPGTTPTREPALHTLYCTEPGAWLTREHDRVVVSVQREVRASVPLGQLDQIAVMDNAMVSTSLLRRCVELRIAVTFAGPGEGVAAVERDAWPDRALTGRQWEAQEHLALGLLLAQRFVEGKLHNSRTVLRRFSRRHGRECIDADLKVIDDCAFRVPRTTTLASLRGLEGVAARHHFDAMRALLPESVTFPARQRQPPADPVNAMLGLGYRVLQVNVHSALRMQGLNPRLGHLHAARSDSLALASDLMEEFRAVAVDAVVLTLWRQGAVRTADFDLSEAPDAEWPCRMRPEARRCFVQALEHRLDAPLVHPRLGVGTDLRRAMLQQAAHYREVLLRRQPVYEPLKFR